MSVEPVYRLGTCGAGAIFRAYEQAAANLGNVEFVAVADQSAQQLRRAKRTGRFLTVDVDELLKEQLDAILILTPNYLHARQSVLALERGHSVLCEKPLATSIAEARHVLAFVEQRRGMLQVAMHCRFRPEIEYFFNHVDGPVISFEQKYLESWMSASEWFFDPRLSGGGVLLDVGINQLDWMLPLFPDITPLRVTYEMGGCEVEVECWLDCVWSHGYGKTHLSWRALQEEKVTTLVTEPGTHFELNHQTHSVRVNGEHKGSWICREYEQVLASFLAQLKEQPAVDRRAQRMLELIGQAYGLAGLPFLNDTLSQPSAGANIQRPK